MTRPLSEVEFYRDESGAPRARGNDSRLATFLETDLQGAREPTAHLLSLLLGEAPNAQWNGNGHSVTISPVMATIESSFDPDAPDRRMTRHELVEAVQAWLEFIT